MNDYKVVEVPANASPEEFVSAIRDTICVEGWKYKACSGELVIFVKEK